MCHQTSWYNAYFESIDELNFSCQHQLVLQLWMYHLKGVVHRVVIDIWITTPKRAHKGLLAKKTFIIGSKITNKSPLTIRNI